jgi:hypothetical protein
MSLFEKAAVSALEFENFDCHPLMAWVRSNDYYAPVAACVLYYVTIFYVIPAVRPKKSGALAKHGFAIWSLGLSIFSGVGIYNAIPYLYRMLQKEGLKHMVCSDHMMTGPKSDPDVSCYGPVGNVMTMFMLSKFPELMDTFFLAWMGKPVILLHWYHHITVLLYSWFAFEVATPSAVIFGTVNYTVHTIMYFYFFASTYTKSLGFMRMPITSMQLSQMVVGCVIVMYSYYQAYYTPEGCSKSYTATHYFVLCFGIYGSYFVLFAQLFYNSYIKKKSPKKLAVKPKKQ